MPSQTKSWRLRARAERCVEVDGLLACLLSFQTIARRLDCFLFWIIVRLKEPVNMKHELPSLGKSLSLVTVLSVTLLFAMPGVVIGQHSVQSDAPVLTQTELESLLAKARAHIEQYPSSFKDLAAEETKTVEIYEKPGKLSGRRQIASDLVIYQSQQDPSAMAEYRNVREVDGILVAGREKRVVKLFERLAKATSVGKELDRINREGSRYDFGWMFAGFTLLKGLPLQKNFHEFFKFEVAGREQSNGHDVVVLRFQQNEQSPDLSGGGRGWLSDFKLTDPRYRGRLWLDASIGQLWREEVELVMRSPKMPDPLVVTRFEFQYAPSEYEVWVPQRMVFNVFSPVKMSAGTAPEMYLRARTVAEYSRFKRFDVQVQEGRASPN